MALATGLKLSIKRIKAKIAAVVETGLVMWHKMTANTWTGANRLPDSSTNSNSAALYTGRGLSFDGVNDVVTVGDTGQTVRTVVFYAYPDSITTAFMQLQSSGAVRVEIASGTLSATGFTSPTLYVNGAAGSTVAATTWQQLAVTSATGVSASNVLLGQSNTSYYGGDLSNVKFFSVQLSAAQIAELYANPEQVLPTGVSSGELVGWWPMADGSAISYILDGSSNRKPGIIAGATELLTINSPARQKSLVGNNQPMFFDGINDSINSTTITTGSNYTVWAKIMLPPGTTPNFPYIVHLGTNTTGNNIGLAITKSTLRPYIYDGTSLNNFTASILTGKYYNLAFTVSSGSNYISYIDGVQDNTSTLLNTTSVNGGFARIGSNLTTSSFANFTGIIYEIAVWNTVLTAANILALESGVLPTSIENANLQFWYKNTGNTNADWIDLSGNGNDGTVNGTPNTIHITEGVTANKDLLNVTLIDTNNGELILNEDGYALITDAATLDITTAITLEAWVKPFTVSTAQTIIGKNTAYALGLTSAGKPVFTKWTSAASTATATTTTALTVNTWYHIAVTYDGTNVKIYIDGAIDTTTAVSGAIDSTSTDVLMGALTTSTELFSGYIDSVKIYSSDLTAAQVAENYNAETAAHSNA